MREFLQSKAGMITAGVVTVLCLSYIGCYLFRDEGPDYELRTYLCAESGKTFTARLKDGETWPVKSPYSKKRTGYPPEKCYWTRDGGVRMEPTYVILNEQLGKTGPTFCPDCGRRVYPRNPMPPDELFYELQAEQEKKK